ncbi:MAG: DUF4258 domain-containing protein [bacterium]
MRFELTAHAKESLRKRPNIRLEWVERVIEGPERVEVDRVDAELEHRLGRVPEYGGRVLRVIVRRGTSPLRIVTLFFDRKMRSQL